MKPTVAGLLFAVLLGLCLVMGLVLMTDPPAGAAGMAHPDYSSMLRGGDGSRHESTLWLGWALGSLEIVFFVGLLVFGTRRRDGFAFEEKVITFGGVLFLLVFTWMVVAYSRFAGTDDVPPIVLGFPVPTALMLFGVGFVPVVFILLYMLRFDPWILTADEEKEFRRKALGLKED